MNQAPSTADTRDGYDPRELLMTRRRRTQIDLDLTTDGKIVYNTDPTTDDALLLFVAGERCFSVNLDSKALAQLTDAITDATQALAENRATTAGHAWAVLAPTDTVTLRLRDPITHQGDTLVMNCVCHTCPGGLCRLTATSHPQDGLVRLALHNDTQVYAVALTPPQQHALATHLHRHDDETAAGLRADAGGQAPLSV